MTQAIHKTQALAQGSPCMVSLILLMDESGSISDQDWRNQVYATADALTHPKVVEAIESAGGVAVMARSFDHRFNVRVSWKLLQNRQDAEAFAQELRSNIARQGGATDIGGAVSSSIPYFSSSPCQVGKRVIDVSTDGDNYNKAAKMRAARDAASRQNITINGIAVEEVRSNDMQERDMQSPLSVEQVKKLLEDYLITPDGFALSANWAEYARVIQHKLLMEIAQGGTGPIRVAELVKTPTRAHDNEITSLPIVSIGNPDESRLAR